MQRLAVAQNNTAISHWAARSCRRVLSHWGFYAQQARQLASDELPRCGSGAEAAAALAAGEGVEQVAAAAAGEG
ncbi:hypothetical protein OEZ85_004486 [Tetradesmus obliquus]|uniref:Uncharacterized protein n=1 Tax=Tetradesmus obliquus TaxID=3088 RepID=A0ABY8ULC0_TETOB|nr:hypothetical protein OEZ85_004486 [Tetradesmus obliquus]